MLHKESIEFAWEFLEFEFKEKNKKWYLIVGIIALILIVVAIISQNYLFAFLILVAGFLMFTMGDKEPMVLGIEVSQHGIKVDDTMYPYTNITGFWITENNNKESILIFTAKRSITPSISVLIPTEINIMQLREHLLDFVEEQEMKEPMVNKIINRIGF